MKYTLVLLAFLFINCKPVTKNISPKLVVVISVDQMRGDYYENLVKPLKLRGGLHKLYTEGKFFADAHHKHAVTTTAAGHATLATGYFPSNNGIVNNTVYNRKQGFSHYCIWDTTVRYVGIDSCDLNLVSAEKLLKPTLGDYVKKENKKSKNYSVALKDRASILMGGKLANRAFWFDEKSTQMVSTDYYTEPYPEWARSFKAKDRLSAEIQTGWNRGLTELTDFTFSNDSFERECGTFKPWFPHNTGSMDTSRVRSNVEGSFMWNTPFGDAFVLDFVKELIIQQDLGKDNYTDVLNIGLSAADVIGHHFGPNSTEILEYYAQIDKELDVFIQFLEKELGKENITLVLTADHGVASLPEILAQSNIDAKRIAPSQYDEDIAVIDSLLQLEFNLPSSSISRANYNGVEPNFNLLLAQGIDSISYINSLMARLEQLDYIAQCYSFFDYQDKNCKKPYIELMRNSHRPEYEYFVKILGKENYLVDMRSCGTTHGSPYTYDTHVPLVFYGGAITPGSDRTKNYTVDIVPSLLELLNIKVSEQFDGNSLGLN